MRMLIPAMIGLMSLTVEAHEKKTDKCGCHHQYGLRHCHTVKKTRLCEAPVKGNHSTGSAAAKNQE